MSVTQPTREHLRLCTEREYLAPVRRMMLCLAGTIPFWIMLGVILGYALSP